MPETPFLAGGPEPVNMSLDPAFNSVLEAFEEGLNPAEFTNQKDAEIIGYGEISSIFSLQKIPGYAFKRLPLFPNQLDADEYVKIYGNYCNLLCNAGLNIPESQTHIIVKSGLPTVLYICQKKLPASMFAHKLIHTLGQDQIHGLLLRVVQETEKVWAYSALKSPQMQFALDAQLSNWVLEGDVKTGTLFYIDTSTPLYRFNGNEQLNPELFLKSAMPGLRWIIRQFFLDDVINRYYDFSSVMTDLTANLYKEKRRDLIPQMIQIINESQWVNSNPLTEKDIESYYKEDKRIWQIVQVSRRIHRWLTTKIFRNRYEFTLPDKIDR